MFNGGKNSLKYKKKDNCFSNSTGSIRCYPDKGMTYKEALVIIKEFKTKLGIKTFKFVNTYRFSVTSSQHYGAIAYFHGYKRHDVEIKLDFNGTMNYLEKAENFSVDLFTHCKYNDALKNFITEYFSIPTATAFLKDKENKHTSDIIENKKREARYRLFSNIQKLKYSSVATFEKALLKYGPESFTSGWAAISGDKDKALLLYDVLVKYGMEKHLEPNLHKWVLENRRLKVFNELDQQNITA